MKTKIILTILVVLAGAYPVRADLVFDSGYNIFDDSYPYYDEVAVINDAHLDVIGGEIGQLQFIYSSTGNIYAVSMGKLVTSDNAFVNIYGGSFDFFSFHAMSYVDLYAYDVTIHPDGGTNNLPWIAGKYYLDNSAFAVTFYDADDISHLSIVPEANSIMLFAFGVLFLTKRNSKRTI